jgi:hypothetical protein
MGDAIPRSATYRPAMATRTSTKRRHQPPKTTGRRRRAITTKHISLDDVDPALKAAVLATKKPGQRIVIEPSLDVVHIVNH